MPYVSIDQKQADSNIVHSYDYFLPFSQEADEALYYNCDLLIADGQMEAAEKLLAAAGKIGALKHICTVDENGEKHGDITYYQGNPGEEKPYGTGHFVHGKEHGTFHFRFDKGERTATYDMGKKDGEEIHIDRSRRPTIITTISFYNQDTLENHFEYDAQGTLRKSQDLTNETLRFPYDTHSEKGRMKEVAFGVTTEKEYDANGQISQVKQYLTHENFGNAQLPFGQNIYFHANGKAKHIDAPYIIDYSPGGFMEGPNGVNNSGFSSSSCGIARSFDETGEMTNADLRINSGRASNIQAEPAVLKNLSDFMKSLGYKVTPPSSEPAYVNPLPVGVAMIPVWHDNKEHLVAITRGNRTKKGGIALVGGYINNNLTGKEGTVLEIDEEIGKKFDPETLIPFAEYSSQILQPKKPNSTLNLFYVTPHLPYEEIDFHHEEKNGEVSAIHLVHLSDDRTHLLNEKDENVELCFPSHQQKAMQYLQQAAARNTP